MPKKKMSEKEKNIIEIIRFLSECSDIHLVNMAGIIGLASDACLRMRKIYEETGVLYGAEVNLIKPLAEEKIRPQDNN